MKLPDFNLTEEQATASWIAGGIGLFILGVSQIEFYKYGPSFPDFPQFLMAMGAMAAVWGWLKRTSK